MAKELVIFQNRVDANPSMGLPSFVIHSTLQKEDLGLVIAAMLIKNLVVNERTVRNYINTNTGGKAFSKAEFDAMPQSEDLTKHIKDDGTNRYRFN